MHFIFQNCIFSVTSRSRGVSISNCLLRDTGNLISRKDFSRKRFFLCYRQYNPRNFFTAFSQFTTIILLITPTLLILLLSRPSQRLGTRKWNCGNPTASLSSFSRLSWRQPRTHGLIDRQLDGATTPLLAAHLCHALGFF